MTSRSQVDHAGGTGPRKRAGGRFPQRSYAKHLEVALRAMLRRRADVKQSMVAETLGMSEGQLSKCLSPNEDYARDRLYIGDILAFVEVAPREVPDLLRRLAGVSERSDGVDDVQDATNDLVAALGRYVGALSTAGPRECAEPLREVRDLAQALLHTMRQMEGEG